MQASSVSRSDFHAADFEAWVRPHVPALHRLAVAASSVGEADDLVQEAIIRAWQKWHLYDENRGSARTWLMALVMEQGRKTWRARRLCVELQEGDLLIHGPDSVSLDLRRAIDRLPPRQRQATVLYYYVDLPVQEVAELMGCSIGTVKSTLSEARTNLCVKLGGSNGGY